MVSEQEVFSNGWIPKNFQTRFRCNCTVSLNLLNYFALLGFFIEPWRLIRLKSAARGPRTVDGTLKKFPHELVPFKNNFIYSKATLAAFPVPPLISAGSASVL